VASRTSSLRGGVVGGSGVGWKGIAVDAMEWLRGNDEGEAWDCVGRLHVRRKRRKS